VTTGQLPKRLIIAFVDQQSFNGSISSNPYNFEHFDHNFIDVKSDATLFLEPLEPNFDKALYMQSYTSLFNATGYNFSNKGPGISHYDYPRGYCLSVFDLTADISSSQSYLRPAQTGNLNLHIKFAKTLPKPITLIVYAEFQNSIEINKYRSVITDF
jgi:hypothetical protein